MFFLLLIILLYIIALFVYGFFTVVITKSPLYCKLYIYAIGSLILGTIFDILYYIFIPIKNPSDFAVSGFCAFGFFLFFLSANFGIMDKIIDDGSKECKKARVLAFVAPIFYLFLMLILLYILSFRISTILFFIYVLPIIPASYFSFKHLISPTNNFNFLKSIKNLHIFSLLLFFFYILFLFSSEDFEKYIIIYIISNIGIAISLTGITFIAKKGSELWSI